MQRRPLKTYGRKPVSYRSAPAFVPLQNYSHLWDSNDSHDSSLKINTEDQTSDNNPFESTFDRIAKDVKLPPVPSDYNANNSILYISSSSSSSLSDINWIKNDKKSLKTSPKKIIGRKRKKKIHPDKKKTVENNGEKITQTGNRKRQNNIKNINKVETENIQPSPPAQKTRRSMKEHKTLTINSSLDELDLNSISIIPSELKKDLKSCCVELTQVKLKDSYSESSEKSNSSLYNNENKNGNEHSLSNDEKSEIINQQNDKFPMIRDCHIVLSRLDINSISSSSISPRSSQKILISSSTPFPHRIHPSNFIPLFSPINNKYSHTNNDLSSIEANGFNEIHETNENTTNKIKLSTSVNDESIVEPSISIKSMQIYSQNNVISSKNNETKWSPTANGKSTELFNSSENIYDDTKNIPENSSKESINLKLKKLHSHMLSSSPDDSKSRLMFEDTNSKLNDDSESNWESYENISNIDKSLLNKSAMSDKIENNETSDVKIIESSTSFLSETMDPIKTINSFNENTPTTNQNTSEDSYHLVVSNTSSASNSPKINTLEITDDKIDNLDNNNSLNINEISDQFNTVNATEAVVLLTRLNDSVKITKRRDKYVTWNHQLKPISENYEKRTSTSILNDNSLSNESDSNKKNKSLESRTFPRFSKRLRFSDRDENSQMLHNKTVDSHNDKIVFLKPGKSWIRSLSILNHINNNDDIEVMSIGKGKKWRQSVQSLLDMQSQGALLNCIKNKDNQNGNETLSYEIPKKDITRISSTTLVGTGESTSPSRFKRRMSIRVVPDNKYSIIDDGDDADTSFLEVYGISRTKNRKTIQKKSISIAPRETFVYNLRHSNADITTSLSEHVDTAKNVVLQRCNQTDYVSFEQCYPEAFLEYCCKIGEGVYGEVFLFQKKKQKSVIKIIPIEGEKLVNGEPQKKFSEILSEIIIAKELHNLRNHNVYRTSGFIEVKNIRCLIGKYPQKLIKHWQLYDEEKTSDNDCPSMFNDDQLYVALELGHGGEDLEAFVFQNATEAYISFVQAALTLAVAEKSMDFEHRDLHWGNILICRTDDTEISYKLDTEEIIFPCKGLKVAIIDFTLSRMSYQGCCIFNDLALDPALFTAVGEYQFEIYKLMKAKVGNDWQLFEPYTNILWLHYTLDKMITSVRYKKKTTKIHKNAILQLQQLKDVILDYDSAYDFIMNCDKLPNLQRRNSSQ